MDGELKMEQIDTLFVRVGLLQGGGVVQRGSHPIFEGCSTAFFFCPPVCLHLFLETFQQSNPFCCNRSTTNLFMISFLSSTIDFFFSFLAYEFICGWPRPVSSRSAKQPGWRSPPIVTIETATWNQSNSPTCELCVADDIQDEQHALSFPLRQSPHDFSPQKICTSVFPPSEAHDVPTFLSQDNNKLNFFLHNLYAFYEQASSRTSWLKAFLCKPYKPCIRKLWIKNHKLQNTGNSSESWPLRPWRALSCMIIHREFVQAVEPHPAFDEAKLIKEQKNGKTMQAGKNNSLQ